jgi:Domain of unknown function (DUF5666)
MKGSLSSPLAQSAGAPNPCYGLGIVAAVHGNALTIKNDDGTKVYQVNQQTEIIRGSKVSLNKLRVGDDVMLWCAGDGGIATSILVNFTRWGGTITAIYPHSFAMFGKGRVGEAPGHVTVLLDGDTNYVQSTLKDLKVGRDVEVSGSIIGPKRVQATAVRIWPN